MRRRRGRAGADAARAQPRAARAAGPARAAADAAPAACSSEVGGIQAQYAPSMYVGLWSRLDGFERDALTRGARAAPVVQATLMRLDDPPRLARATSGRSRWRRARARRAGGCARRADLTRAAMAGAARALRAALATAPMSRREIEALVGKPRAAGVGLWVDLVRVPPSGTWERRRADLYAARRGLARPAAAAPRRRGASTSCAATSAASARRPGPTSRASPGSGSRALAPALERLDAAALPRRGRRGAARPARARRCPTADTPGPAALPADLGRDAARPRAPRRGILPEAYRPRIFNTKNAARRSRRSSSTARSRRRGGTRTARSRLEPFAALAPADDAALEAEAARLAAFHA